MTLNDLISISEMTFKKVVLRSKEDNKYKEIDITNDLEKYKSFDVNSFDITSETYQNYETVEREYTLYVSLNYSATDVYATIRQELEAYANENEIELNFLDNFDSAIVGISEDNRVIYSYNKMVESLVNEETSSLDAMNFIDCNITLNTLNCKNAPIIMYSH